MARIYPSSRDDLETVAKQLLDQVGQGNQRRIVYDPSDGPLGVFLVEDDVAEGYDASGARTRGEEVEQEREQLRQADVAVRIAPQPHEPTAEDDKAEGYKTNAVRGTYDAEGGEQQVTAEESEQPRPRRARRPAGQTTEE